MKKMKRLLSLLTVGTMAFSMMTTTAHAATNITGLDPVETAEGNLWYGDNISVDIEAGENGYTFRSVCAYEKGTEQYNYNPNLFRHSAYEMSPHMMKLEGVTNPESPSLWILADASKDYTWEPSGPYSYGDSNYDILYCCDVETAIKDAKYYKRVNLEDSNYYDDEAAARIRGILTNSYPYVTVDEMKEALAANGFEYADELTRADIIAAVQSAIWTCANGRYNEERVSEIQYLQTINVTLNTQWGGALHDITNETKKAWTNTEVAFPTKSRTPAVDENVGERINSLIEYLVAQEAVSVEQEEIIVSGIKIIESAPLPSNDASKKDVYSVTLQVALNNSGSGESDNINLAVYTDDELVITNPISFGTEEYTFNVEAKLGQTIKVVVSGTQVVPKGIYFYEAEGGRKESQSLVGVGEGETDVYAEASVVMQERILQFHKKTEVNNVQYPLKGIEFELYYVSSVEDYNNILTDGDAANDAAYETPSKEAFPNAVPVGTVVTDEGGRAAYNLTQNSQPDGIYMVVEKEHDAVKEVLKPFLVAVPMTDDDGFPVYQMNVSLKNEIYVPDVDKDVTEIGQDLATQNVGDTVTWIIRGDLPKDMAKSSHYKLTDVLDYRLTYDGNLVVKVEKLTDKADNTATGANVLNKGTDYSLHVTERDGVTTIVVDLTKVGRAKAAQLAGAEYADYEVRVYFDSHIDEDAIFDEDDTEKNKIPNTVTLGYTNSANFEWTVVPEENEIPAVYTCGVNLYKYDAKDYNVALAGAKFKLAKVVEEGTTGATQLVTKEDGVKNVVYVDFYTAMADNKLDTNSKMSEVETDENGKAMLYGLAEGTYYLVETKAPVLVDENTGEVTAAYNLLSYPVKVTVDEVSHLEAIEVANSNQFRLPSTGGIGTGIFTMSGGTLIALAGAVLIRNKKKETEE